MMAQHTTIRTGISTFVYASPFKTADFHLLPKIRSAGYDIVEVAVEQADLIDWDLLVSMTRDLGLQITLSGAFGPRRDISSDNAAFRKEGLDYILECIRLAEKTGSPCSEGPCIPPWAKPASCRRSRSGRSGPGAWRTCASPPGPRKTTGSSREWNR